MARFARYDRGLLRGGRGRGGDGDRYRGRGARRGAEAGAWYGRRRWGERPVWMPRKPAHGFPVRGYHTYDLDYGTVSGGPTTDYSGRVGYPAPDEFFEWELEWLPRGPYTPYLEEREGRPRGLYEERRRAYGAGRRERRRRERSRPGPGL